MSIKTLAKSLIPAIVINVANQATGRTQQKKNEQMLQNYLQNGKVPWSIGYNLYKENFIVQALTEESLKLFRAGEVLSPNYGVGVDERCIEYPWLFANLPTNAKCILDAGSALNHHFILNNPLWDHKRLHIITLAPEGNCLWQKGISYLYDDLRNIPIRNDYYEAIVCLSTLEHLGCDNTIYTKNETYQENNLEDYLIAIKELNRILKPGGSLFFSVPFGVYRNFGSFQQFDRKLLDCAIEAFDASEVVENFYRYTAEGWQVAKASDCAECEYVEWIAKAWQQQQLPDTIPKEPDLAAAARAVACVKLVKR